MTYKLGSSLAAPLLATPIFGDTKHIPSSAEQVTLLELQTDARLMSATIARRHIDGIGKISRLALYYSFSKTIEMVLRILAMIRLLDM